MQATTDIRRGEWMAQECRSSEGTTMIVQLSAQHLLDDSSLIEDVLDVLFDRLGEVTLDLRVREPRAELRMPARIAQPCCHPVTP